MNDGMIDAILDKERFAEWVGLQTAASRICLAKQLHEWKSNDAELMSLCTKFNRFKEAMEKDSAFFQKASGIFKEMAEVETTLNTLMKQDSKLEQE